MHIRMYRHHDAFYADVHPDMVDDYRAGGFSVVENQAQDDDSATDQPDETTEKRGRGRPRKEVAL